MAKKRTTGFTCIMMLEDNVVELRFVSHAKQKTCSMPHIYEYPVQQEKEGSRIL